MGVLGEGRKGGKWKWPHGQTFRERTSRGDLLDQVASRNILEDRRWKEYAPDPLRAWKIPDRGFVTGPFWT